MSAKAQTFVSGAKTLPSLPLTYHQLVTKLRDPDSSLDEVTEVLKQDMSLASRLLKLANSAFFGFSTRIATLEDAIQCIGFAELQNLVLATSLITAFKGVPAHLISVQDFWAHGIACGVASSLLAEQRMDPTPERFFVAGLIHDIGRLLMFLNAPAQSATAIDRCRSQERLAPGVESEVFGFDHADLGAELISLWRLPPALGEIVGNHHDPAKANGVVSDAFIVHYADFISSGLDWGASGEVFVPPLRVPSACQKSVLEADQLEALANELERRLESILPVLLENKA